MLVYLLIRLDLPEELDALMESLTADEESETAYEANLQAIGATYAYLKRLDKVEAYYERMSAPRARFYLATGVIDGLQLRASQK